MKCGLVDGGRAPGQVRPGARSSVPPCHAPVSTVTAEAGRGGVVHSSRGEIGGGGRQVFVVELLLRSLGLAVDCGKVSGVETPRVWIGSVRYKYAFGTFLGRSVTGR